ncbi:MAG: ComEC/Rec2 family competence protein [Bdellovibrionales bacterium]|nr:ComEC/Rec2 family competence protein [Bdellovibrionales bacterium]
MAGLMGFLGISLLGLGFGLHSFLADLSEPLHKICLNSMPAASHWRFAYASIICGAPLTEEALRQSLLAAGLIHLLVVSGLHLVLMQSWIQILLRPLKNFTLARPALIVALCLYAASCQLNPPITRALMGFFISNLNQKRKWFLTSAERTALAGVTCLTLFPEWWSSLSLPLSWTATLALIIAPKKPLFAALSVYIFLIPPLLSLGIPHPASVFVNLLIAPILGHVLFPLSLLASMAKPLTVLADGLWTLCFQVLSRLEPHLGAPQKLASPSLSFLWIYLLGLQLVAIKKCRRRTRL